MHKQFYWGVAFGLVVSIAMGGVAVWSLSRTGVEAHVNADIVANQVEEEVLSIGREQAANFRAALQEDLPDRLVEKTADGFEQAFESVYGEDLFLPEEVTGPIRQHLKQHLENELTDLFQDEDFEPLIQKLARRSRVKTSAVLQQQEESIEMQAHLMDRWTVPIKLRIAADEDR